MSAEPAKARVEPHRAVFATTLWSVVLAAGQHDTPQSAGGLDQLCRTYWYPLCAYVRRRGYSVEDSQDLTQQFFARILQHRSFGLAGRERSKT